MGAGRGKVKVKRTGEDRKEAKVKKETDDHRSDLGTARSLHSAD